MHVLRHKLGFTVVSALLFSSCSSTSEELIQSNAEGASQNDKKCYWQIEGGMYCYSHFRFKLTTPDGQQQSPPREYPPDAGKPALDGGVAPANDFEGRIASTSGSQFAVDSCLSPAACQPSLYEFTLPSAGTCGSPGRPEPVVMPVPIGRRVRVVWRLDNDMPLYSPGLYFLAIYDAETGPSHGNLLFLGSGGRDGTTSGRSGNPLASLPFTTTTQALSCGDRARDASMMKGDDYAFVFTAKNGSSTPLRLANGQSGFLEVASPAGGTQRLKLHCLTAVQPASTDNYWNWDFWAAGEIAAGPVDSGASTD